MPDIMAGFTDYLLTPLNIKTNFHIFFMLFHMLFPSFFMEGTKVWLF